MVSAAAGLTNQEISNAVMHLVSHDQDRLTDQRVERIFDLRFECQKPGTMIPAPMAGPRTGRSSPRSSKPRYAELGITRFMPPPNYSERVGLFP
jgi:hypothetical protein